jgi:predicted dithiol-disulfide oxidoreductase (DUF899 family)
VGRGALQDLKQEKELTRLRDKLSAQRRDLPWVRVDTDYVFDGPDGKIGLPELFGDKSQLIVQHFMFGPDWYAGCKSCSFWADNFNGIVVHLQQRDIAFMVVWQAPFGRTEEYRQRMGWGSNWVRQPEPTSTTTIMYHSLRIKASAEKFTITTSRERHR